MGAHIGYHFYMKTTIDIADDLFERAQQKARREKTTFRALTEAGLRIVLSGQSPRRARKLPPLVSYGKGGLTKEFENASWPDVRDEIYRGRGA